MSRLWLDHPWRLRAAVLLLAVGVVVLLRGLAPQVGHGVEHALGDLAWRVGTHAAPEKRVVVVDIDEQSLREVGPWPWPRATMAQLVDKLDKAGVAVQAFDLVFDATRDDDTLLAEAWARVGAVPGQILTVDPATVPRIGQVAGGLAAAGCPDFAPRTSGYIGNSASLRTDGLAVGHMTPRVEMDGVVRKVPALICHQGKAYPSLALAALWRAAQAQGGKGAPDWAWSVSPSGVLAPHALLSSASLPGVTVPVDEHGDMRVPFRADRKAIMSVSAAQVLNGSADTSVLRGSIVLVGATAFGLGDAAATPLASVSSGLEVHVQSMAGLLDHRVPVTPRHAVWLAALGLVLTGALLAALAAHRGDAPVKRLPLVGLGLALLIYTGASAALLTLDLWLPWFEVAVFALLASVALATAEHAITRAQRQRLSAHLGSYLPAPVAQRLMASDPSGTLQVNRRNVSVLVADIRNFSAFAAHRSPEETAALLHAFYCLAVDVVEQQGGVVENIVGDSVMAVWNAYADCPRHGEQALQAAKELVRATRSLLVRPDVKIDDPVLQPLALGVGVESGSAVVGSFGPRRRRAHVALGEPVSVASRLQQMTQDLSMPILIGPQLAGQLASGSTEPLGDYLLEGMGRQVTLHAPGDWADLVPTEQLWTSHHSEPLHFDDNGEWFDPTAPGASLAFSSVPPRHGA